MPVKTDVVTLEPPPPANSCQPGVTRSLLYNGSRFQGHQKSKGKSYEVEVVLQVGLFFVASLSLHGIISKFREKYCNNLDKRKVSL